MQRIKIYARLIIAALCTVATANAQQPTPKSFFIAAHVVSETLPGSSEDIIDVQPLDSGSLVRHFRIAPAAESCPNNIAIRAEERKLKLAPAQLATTVNPCTISNGDFQQAIEGASLKGRNTDNAVGYTVVAACGLQERVFRIPYVQTLDLQALRKDSVNAADLIALYSIILKAVFPSDTMSKVKPVKDKELQANGQKLLSLLQSGRFDRGFDGSFQNLLARYKGPFAALQPVSKLVDADRWRFISYVDPASPSGQKRPDIDTQVDADLVVDIDSGRVRSLKIVRGNPALTRLTTDAIVQWVFDPGQRLTNPLRVTIDYSLPCKIVR